MKPEVLDGLSKKSRVVMDLCAFAGGWEEEKVERRSLAAKLPIVTECKFGFGQSEGRFYVHPVQLEAERVVLRDQLKLNYQYLRSSKALNIEECVVGLLCAVQHESGWVRGRVVAVNDDREKAHVFLFDVGLEEEFNVSQLFRLDEKFQKNPPMALACQMSLDDWDTEFENLKFVMQSATFLVRVFALNTPLCVDVKDLNERCLTQYTVVHEADGSRCPKPPGGVYIKASGRTQMQVVNKHKIKYPAPDCDQEVVLSQIGMQTVYVHSKVNLDNLEQLRIDLAEFYNKLQYPPDVKLEADTVCVVWSPEFDSYVRAKITNVDEVIELTAIDYGVQIEAIRRSDKHLLKPLYDGFVAQPHVYCVRLGLLTPKKNKESEAEKTLDSVFEAGTCYHMGLVKSLTGHPPPKIDLFELSDKQCKHSLTDRCNAALVEAQLARDPKPERSPVVYKQTFAVLDKEKVVVMPKDYGLNGVLEQSDAKYPRPSGAWPPQEKGKRRFPTDKRAAAGKERSYPVVHKDGFGARVGIRGGRGFPALRARAGRGRGGGFPVQQNGFGYPLPRTNRSGFGSRMQSNGFGSDSKLNHKGARIEAIGPMKFGSSNNFGKPFNSERYRRGSTSSFGAQRKFGDRPVFGSNGWKTQEGFFGRGSTEEKPIKPIDKMHLSEDLQRLKLNSKFVVVTSAQAVNKIYIRSLDVVKAANEFEHKLERHYKALSLKQDPLPPSKFREGAYYVAQSCTLSRDYGEQTWRRVQIKRTKAHAVVVEFIDFGYEEEIPNNEFYALEPEFADQPCFCSGPCVLFGSETKQIAPKIQQTLASHLAPLDKHKMLRIERTDPKRKDPPAITLTKNTDKELVNLNQTFFLANGLC